MLRALRNITFLLFTLTRLVRHGVLPLRWRSPDAKRVAAALERMGPTFIKLGQTLSTRADLIGEELAAELANLRDQLPPFPASVARRIIAEEFGAPPEAIFARFEDAPVAAASVAQVHRAMTRSGQYVAVKILRPGIHVAFRRDIELFAWTADAIEKWIPSLRRLKPREMVRTFERSVAFELDLRYEAAAIEEMRLNIRDDAGWRVPAVTWNLTAGRAMVTEWIEGVPIHDVEALRAAGHDLNAVLVRLSEHFFKHVFRDGFFHADLHPGNVFVDAAGNITVVDFGIMGRLAWKERLYVAEIFRGFLNEDYRHVAELHFRAGYVPGYHSVEEFAQAAMAIAKPILGRPVHEISVARLLGQLFKATETFNMETQPQLLLLQKSMVVVEGVGRMLNPGVNMWDMARPPIESWAREHLGYAGRLRHAALEAKDAAQLLPEALPKLRQALEHWANPQGLRLHPSFLAPLVEDRRSIRRQLILLGWAWLLLAAIYLLSR